MGDEADVRLVDPHAEGDGGADHHVFGGHEIGWFFARTAGSSPAMIGAYRAAGPRQRLGQLLGRRAGLGIDDAGAGRVGDHPRDLQVHIRLGADRIADIGPVEARDDHALGGIPSCLAMSARVCASAVARQREPGHLGKGVHQRFEQAIVGAEVVPPFADAVRLVDREQAERRGGEQLAEMSRRRALGAT